MQAPALVILTQEAADNARLAALLSGPGLRAISYPCIETKLLPWDGQALPDGQRLEDFAVLAFTSRRGVQGAEGLRERINAAGIAIACVGTATAQEAAERLGLPCRITGREQNAASLALAIAGAFETPARLLHLRGNRGSGEFAGLLRERGWEVCEVVVYENMPLSPAPLPAGHYSAAVFASPSAAEQFAGANPGLLEQLDCVAIGAVTGQRLRSLGAKQVTEAAQPGPRAVADTVLALLQTMEVKEGRLT